MFGAHSNKTQLERILIITLGNSGSEAYIIEKVEGKKIQILFNVKDASESFETTELSRLKTLFFASFKNVLSQTLKSGVPISTIQKVVITLSAPWDISRSKTLSFSDTKPFTIKQSMVDDLMHAAGADFQSEILHENMVCYQEKILTIFLNGYPTSSPLGKEVSSLHISAVQSFIARSVQQAIYTAFEKIVPKNKITLLSSSFSMLEGLSVIGRPEKDFLMCLIGNEITEIILVRDGTLKDTVTMPKGKKYVVKTLGEKMNATAESSSSLIKLFSEKLLEKSLSEKIQNVMDEIGKNWLKDMREACQKINDLLPLPSTVFVMSSPQEEKIFSEWLTSDQFYGFKPMSLTTSDIAKWIDIPKNNVPEIFPIIEILGVALK